MGGIIPFFSINQKKILMPGTRGTWPRTKVMFADSLTNGVMAASASWSLHTLH